jgi:3-phenylpropionate/trans-cinnamate dioxygenase ferredoxin reductase subunit
VVEGVVAGIGVMPNVDLARSAGLEVDEGIILDEFLRTLRTSDSNVYAAGDVANFSNPAVQKRLRG